MFTEMHQTSALRHAHIQKFAVKLGGSLVGLVLWKKGKTIVLLFFSIYGFHIYKSMHL